MKKTVITLHVNGVKRDVYADPCTPLLDIIRGEFNLTGTKHGCGEGECGACTVIIDGKATLACITPVAQVEGQEITTIESLAKNGELTPLQQAFIDEWAFQCGFCTPGMIMAAKALLDENPKPSEMEIRSALAGNLCRCTGYHKIIRAVNKVAESQQGEGV
ncbi:MAG: (2Fe-2S)-binding protein [Candidatus Korobacteraceae bacterium]|jgi:aerobic-type carbon monoxide dehydrogenase small subunit (CoxS/CutS family)